jgi:hypothetical protein
MKMRPISAIVPFPARSNNTSAPNPKFAQRCPESDRELRVQKGALES